MFLSDFAIRRPIITIVTMIALVAMGLLLPFFMTIWWMRLRAFEVGAPAVEDRYRLLRGNSIFSPLPMATLERLSHDLQPVEVPAGKDVHDGDIFQLNADFVGAAFRVHINSIQVKEAVRPLPPCKFSP